MQFFKIKIKYNFGTEKWEAIDDVQEINHDEWDHAILEVALDVDATFTLPMQDNPTVRCIYLNKTEEFYIRGERLNEEVIQSYFQQTMN